LLNGIPGDDDFDDNRGNDAPDDPDDPDDDGPGDLIEHPDDSDHRDENPTIPSTEFRTTWQTQSLR